jgi:type IV fimbrial biogenesis protein FimT
MKRSTSQGVTLVELMITVSLTAILLALAVPPFREMILNNRRAAQLNALTGSLNLARSAAVKGGSDAFVCISDGATPPDCDTAATDWEAGWLVIVDSNKDGNVTSAGDEPRDQVLEVHEALAGGFTLRGNANVAWRVAYSSRGSATNGTLTLCDSRGASGARGIVISNAGRARLTSDTDVLTCP